MKVVILILTVLLLFSIGFWVGIQIEKINELEKRVDKLESEVDTE